MQQNMERHLHFPTTTAFHIHMDPTNSAWWSRCLSKPCGSQSRVIYLLWTWNFGTEIAIALTKIHATKHGTASPFSNYHCISHPLDPTNSGWWSRCLSWPCGSQSRVIYVPWTWNFVGTKVAIALTKIHATKHGTASPFSDYYCTSHPYGSNKQCLMI
jgi:hypothetical protein